MYLSDLCIRRPVLTLIMSSVFIIFGIIGYQRLGLDQYPYVEFPYVTVTTTLSGASPEVMDMDVTDILEEQFNSIPGIKHITSISLLGRSVITLEFYLEKDIDIAATEVQNKIGLAMKDLPRDVDPPTIDKLSTDSIPPIWFALHSKTRPFRDLCHFADKVLRRRLETVIGVGGVEIHGFRDREIELWLSLERLVSYQLSPQQVVQSLQEQHLKLPGGLLKTGPTELLVKTMGEFRTPEEFNNLIVAYKDSTPIRLRDIGYAEDTLEEERSLLRFNRQPAVGISVKKQTGTNTVAVAERIKQRMQELEPLMPEGMEYTISWDTSKFIRNTIIGVQIDLGYGIILTFLILFVFLLNFRTTILVNLAIPTSIVGTFAFMYFLDFTANNMTMVALSVAVGLVVDNAIVVLENIYRHMEEGKEPKEAASFGTREVGFAVIVGSLSICVIFIPIAFIKGIMGRFLYPFGATVGLAILISLFISLTLTPMLCSRIIRVKRKEEREQENIIYRSIEVTLAATNRAYRVLLRSALHRRGLVLLCAGAVFVITLVLGRAMKKQFMPLEDRGCYLIKIRAPVGSSLKYTEGFAKRVEDIVLAEPENIMHTSGIGSWFTDDVNAGIFFVVMDDWNKRERSQQEIQAILREKFKTIPGITIYTEEISPIGRIGRTTDVNAIIKGPDMDKLAEYATKIMNLYKKIPGIVGVDYDLELEKPETRVYIDRDKAADIGVKVSTIANTLRTLIDGYEAAKFEEEGERYDIRVRMLEPYRTKPSDLMNIPVPSDNGQLIVLRNLVHLESGVSPQSIRRFDRQHAVQIFANARGNKTAGEAIEDLKRIAKQVLPEESGYQISFAGTSEDMMEMFQSLTFAFYLAVLVVYMLLASQFESFIHPFTILLSLPLALFGAFGALYITGKTLNLFSLIGLIMLVGLVTKNAILLIDYTNILRQRGLPRDQAILEAGPVRLRPVLMTALSTIFGLLPLALELSEGGEVRSPMAIAVGGGMFTSTLLTLILIPVVYSLLDDLAAKTKGVFKAIRHP